MEEEPEPRLRRASSLAGSTAVPTPRPRGSALARDRPREGDTRVGDPERAGFTRGYGNPEGIAISSKHTLALTNRGGGTTAELLALAREIRDGVRDAFGVTLEPEPTLVGTTL